MFLKDAWAVNLPCDTAFRNIIGEVILKNVVINNQEALTSFWHCYIQLLRFYFYSSATKFCILWDTSRSDNIVGDFLILLLQFRLLYTEDEKGQ